MTDAKNQDRTLAESPTDNRKPTRIGSDEQMVLTSTAQAAIPGRGRKDMQAGCQPLLPAAVNAVG